MATPSTGQRVALVAVDSSEHSKKAFHWYLENLYKPGDSIVICHVPETPHLHALSIFKGSALKPPVEEWQQALSELHGKTEKLLGDYEFELRNKNLKDFKCVEEHHEKPGRGIIEAARQYKATMIIVGTRGLDAMGRAFRGSVSDSVVHHSSVPVIICPDCGN